MNHINVPTMTRDAEYKLQNILVMMYTHTAYKCLQRMRTAAQF
jgi:hypothetical protein